MFPVTDLIVKRNGGYWYNESIVECLVSTAGILYRLRVRDLIVVWGQIPVKASEAIFDVLNRLLSILGRNKK